MHQRLGYGFVGIRYIDIFAHEADADLAIRIMHGMGNAFPAAQIRLGRPLHPEVPENLVIQPLLMIGSGDIINMPHIPRLNDT